MRKDKLRIIGWVMMFVVIAIVVICFDDIQAMVNEVMVEQAESLVDQLLRQEAIMGKIILVGATKGGVGKSVTSYNTGYQIT